MNRAGRVRRPMMVPTKLELLNALDRAHREIELMIGNARGGIPESVRDHLAEIATPVHTLLRCGGRR